MCQDGSHKSGKRVTIAPPATWRCILKRCMQRTPDKWASTALKKVGKRVTKVPFPATWRLHAMSWLTYQKKRVEGAELMGPFFRTNSCSRGPQQQQRRQTVWRKSVVARNCIVTRDEEWLGMYMCDRIRHDHKSTAILPSIRAAQRLIVMRFCVWQQRKRAYVKKKGVKIDEVVIATASRRRVDN